MKKHFLTYELEDIRESSQNLIDSINSLEFLLGIDKIAEQREKGTAYQKTLSEVHDNIEIIINHLEHYQATFNRSDKNE